MTNLPSSTYLLLTSPAVWVEKPMEDDVLKGLAPGGWTWNPNEAPPGRDPLPVALVKALDAMEFKRDPAANGGLAYRLDIDRKRAAFQRTLGAVLAAGGRLQRSSLPVLASEPHVQRWVWEIAWEDGAHAAALNRGRELARGITSEAVRAHSPLFLQTQIAGLPVWAHIARQAVEDPCLFFDISGNSMGLVERQSSWHETQENGALVLALHERAVASADPVALAWWSLIASPFRRYSRPLKERTLSSHQCALNVAWESVQEHPDLARLLSDVLAAAASSALSSPLSAAVLTALPDLGRWLPREQAWEIAARALAQMCSFQSPTVAPCFWKGARFDYQVGNPGIPTADCSEWRAVRRAAYQVVARFGWPTLEWAEREGRTPEALGFLLTALAHFPSQVHDGVVRAWPALQQLVEWGVWARTHQAPWPTPEQVEEWDLESNDAARAGAVFWERLDASIRLEAALKPAGSAKPRHRL